MLQADTVCTELRGLPGNGSCADCLQAGPLNQAVFPHGILVCKRCADIHRSLDYRVSKVKSLTEDHWTADELKTMLRGGNILAAKDYESHVPVYYRRPSSNSPFVLLEQWIRAKYERYEFTGQKSGAAQYEVTKREDVLMKRGKNNPTFKPRLFIIDANENTLRYYNQAKMETPKSTYRLDSLNVAFVPDKCHHPHAVQLTHMWNQDPAGSSRNIYLYAESGKQLVSWYTTIRAIKHQRMSKSWPRLGSSEICGLLTYDFTKEGWLKKSGSKTWNSHRLRWMTLDQNRLFYYETPLDASPKGSGVIVIGKKEQGFAVRKGIPAGITSPGEFCFTLKTPGRKFFMAAESAEELLDWMRVLKALL